MADIDTPDKFGFVHKGVLFRRTQDDCHHGRMEKAFAEHWDREQKPKAYVNYGVGALAWIVTGRFEKNIFGHDWTPHPEELTQRDATVAASVVQWLGTNVGFCFLEETLRDAGYRIERIKDHA